MGAKHRVPARRLGLIAGLGTESIGIDVDQVTIDGVTVAAADWSAVFHPAEPLADRS